jgi:ribonuclease HII
LIKSKKSKINSLIKFDSSFSDNIIIGLDEAGRGPGAGDVFAAGVYFPEITKGLKKDLSKLDDSKQLSAKIREELAILIKKNSIYSISRGSIDEIETINILQTSLLSMKRSALAVLEQIQIQIQIQIQNKEPLLLIDGNKLIKDFEIKQQFVVKGDGKSLSIAAASILAKTERDDYMIELAEKHPEYDWQNNKGYLTPKHLEAIDKYGITPYHRKSFLTKQLKLIF